MAPLATRIIATGRETLDRAMAEDLQLWGPVVRERGIVLD